MNPTVNAFFHQDTSTYSYVLADPETGKCAVIDPVLDYAPASARTGTESADRLIDCVESQQLTNEWILETHVHADHISAAPYIKSHLGGKTGIGKHIIAVQKIFSAFFAVEADFHADGSQFDHLFDDDEMFEVGTIRGVALHTPGHTPACMTYLIGDAGFVGDTLFMPDYGTARCDFPGGDAYKLYRSIQRIFSLPEWTRLLLCHDYPPPGRDEHQYQTTVGEEKRHNIHVHHGVTEEEFVAMRLAKDARSTAPRLILPSVQMNIRAGEFPPAEPDGRHFLKIPLNAL